MCVCVYTGPGGTRNRLGGSTLLPTTPTQPNTSDHTLPWEPGGPGGWSLLCVRARVSVRMPLCVCVFFVFFFEVCPSKREMRGSDLLFFWWARSEGALIHNYLAGRGGGSGGDGCGVWTRGGAS